MRGRCDLRILWGGREFCGSAGLEMGKDRLKGRVSGAAWGLLRP